MKSIGGSILDQPMDPSPSAVEPIEGADVQLARGILAEGADADAGWR
jgi:hypothetical protein